MGVLSRRRTLALAAVAAGCALFTSTPDAEAQGNPKADVLVIHATQCDKPSVDPQIGEAPPLKYNCYKLIERKNLPLTKGQAATTGLPNGRTFQVLLNDTTPDKRFKITASISQPDNKGFLKLADITADANKQFHVGGFAYQGGALVLAIRIAP
jgi:hypothetical protein